MTITLKELIEWRDALSVVAPSRFAVTVDGYDLPRNHKDALTDAWCAMTARIKMLSEKVEVNVEA